MLQRITTQPILLFKCNHIRIIDMSIPARHTLHKSARYVKTLQRFLSACI